MRQFWWKILAAGLVLYTVIGGLALPVPRLNILNETARNLYFHVPMWFVMMVLFTVSAVYAILYLRTSKPKHDIRSVAFLEVGVVFSILGLVTGMIWGQHTWGSAWNNDPKQLGTALCMLTYFAYLVLRSGIGDEEKRARISAVYNIFAFALIYPLLVTLPKLADSLHPGSGGNSGFAIYDPANLMKAVFYPAVPGWILLGVWIATQNVRMRMLRADHDADVFNAGRR